MSGPEARAPPAMQTNARLPAANSVPASRQPPPPTADDEEDANSYDSDDASKMLICTDIWTCLYPMGTTQNKMVYRASLASQIA